VAAAGAASSTQPRRANVVEADEAENNARKAFMAEYLTASNAETAGPVRSPRPKAPSSIYSRFSKMRGPPVHHAGGVRPSRDLGAQTPIRDAMDRAAKRLVLVTADSLALLSTLSSCVDSGQAANTPHPHLYPAAAPFFRLGRRAPPTFP